MYRCLSEHLDDLPGGFPPTDSGVELRILRRLFTEAEAALAVHLTVLPEPARVVGRRAGLTTEEASKRLEEMARKGLIFRMETGGKSRYMAAQFVIGIWEYQVNDLDEGLIRDVNAYLPTLVDAESWKKAPQLRTIPVGRSLDVRHAALPYEQAEQLVREAERHLVAPCICRREHRILGKGCDNPEETCLIFDWAADYYATRGIGRMIDQAEALRILRDADESGLVVQPSNSQKAISICLCCGCCCQALKALKRSPRPADLVSSPFAAKLGSERCIGCGLCAERCQMEALRLADGRAQLDAGRCIGCGLCVSTCPTEALVLERKRERPDVPANIQGAMLRLGKARGKFSAPSLAWIVLKSKLDRLLANG